MRIIFHPEALDEMIGAARFFEQKCDGLGLDLIDAVEKSVRQIAKFPKAGRIERAEIRKRLVRGFPFSLLYQSNADSVFIVAVMH